LWVLAGAFEDGSRANPRLCLGSFPTPADSLTSRARAVTVRFLRDRRAEARGDFGGYRIYRVTNAPDTTRMVLIRRFSRQFGDERTWSFSVVDTRDTTTLPARSTLPFKCTRRVGSSLIREVVHDSVVTFVDPDSNGNFVKLACRDENGRIRPGCDPRVPGDSIITLVAPPGPHDGFRTWYAVTYEGLNQSSDATYEDLFVPDTLGIIDTCRVRGNLATCPNLNNKCYNLSTIEVEPTGGPTTNLERVGVVPNPFREREVWDRPGANELHFINLPEQATIRIYTVAGDLVVQLEHNDKVRDFERWNLKNQDGRDVASGIYLFRIESRVPRNFSFQDRFIVIR
jgi:hypothetical protein